MNKIQITSCTDNSDRLKVFETSVYICRDCNTIFVTGISLGYYNHYLRQGWKKNRIFKEYLKELEKAGAKTMPVLEHSGNCPNCKSKNIKEITPESTDVSSYEHFYDCEMCGRRCSKGIPKNYSFIFQSLGINHFHAFEIFKKDMVLRGSVIYRFIDTPRVCPYCGADGKYLV
ncbi:MAG: hypothetical protein PHU63_03595 [Candidatus ainarchaeum sp.]|nr:hypothetical protein [Candidatus ainarchaeum sp.]